MIERHIAFAVEPARSDDFERFFSQRYRPAASKSPGYVRVELLRSQDEPSRYEMTFQWDGPDAAAGWRTSPEHTDLQPELKSLSAMGDIRIFSVVG